MGGVELREASAADALQCASSTPSRKAHAVSDRNRPDDCRLSELDRTRARAVNKCMRIDSLRNERDPAPNVGGDRSDQRREDSFSNESRPWLSQYQTSLDPMRHRCTCRKSA